MFILGYLPFTVLYLFRLGIPQNERNKKKNKHVLISTNIYTEIILGNPHQRNGIRYIGNLFYVNHFDRG